MRYKLLTIGAAFMALTLAGPTSGQSPKCALISDPDERMICNAVTSGRKSWCSYVSDPQKRATCHALLDRK